MHKYSLWGLVISLVIGAAGLALAQADCAATITAGETYRGSITDADSVHYLCFEGREDVTVIIEMSSPDGSLDSLAQLADGSFDEILAQNDDASFGNSDSLLEYTLPEDGPYIIVATRYEFEDGITTGEYELTLTTVGNVPLEPEAASAPEAEPEIEPAAETVEAAPLIDADCPGSPLAYGQRFAGEIDDERFGYTLCFTGRAGETVVIDMTALEGNLDPYLILMQADFTADDLGLYAANDNVVSLLPDAQITFTLPETATYLVVATRIDLKDGATTGMFDLQIIGR